MNIIKGGEGILEGSRHIGFLKRISLGPKDFTTNHKLINYGPTGQDMLL